MNYVADTHALLWHFTDSPKLSSRALELFAACERGECVIFIPSIVIAESLSIFDKKKLSFDFKKLLKKNPRKRKFHTHPARLPHSPEDDRPEGNPGTPRQDHRLNGEISQHELCEFFKNLENHGNIGDKNEGLVECFQSRKIDVIFKNPTDQSTILSTKDGSLAITGQMRTWDALIDQQNIFCMYALKYKGVKPLIDGKNIEFGDTYVAITKPEAFMNRIKATAQKIKQNLRADLVKYANRKKHHGKMGIFKKFKEYEYQSEYRIVLSPGYGGPFRFVIGDISDISATGNTADINSRIEIIEKKYPKED